MFPRRRFEEAGASADELDALQAEFDRLSPDAQAGQAHQWAGLGQGDLAELLEHRRQATARGADVETETDPSTGATQSTPSPTRAADEAAKSNPDPGQ